MWLQNIGSRFHSLDGCFCEENTPPFSMVLIFNPALVTRSVSWLFIFHSLQVYRNRWTEWFWVWADIPAEEGDGGVGTTHLASRADARLGQICLPVRYPRVNTALAFSCSASKGPRLLQGVTLVSSAPSQVLGIVVVWELKRVCSFFQPGLQGQNQLFRLLQILSTEKLKLHNSH